MKDEYFAQLFVWFLKSDYFESIQEDFFEWLKIKAEDTENPWDDEAVRIAEMIAAYVLKKYAK